MHPTGALEADGGMFGKLNISSLVLLTIWISTTRVLRSWEHYTRRSFESLRICLHTVSSESLQHFFIPRPAVTPRELVSSARISGGLPTNQAETSNYGFTGLQKARSHKSFFSFLLFSSRKRSSLILVLLIMPLLLLLCAFVYNILLSARESLWANPQHTSAVNERDAVVGRE